MLLAAALLAASFARAAAAQSAGSRGLEITPGAALLRTDRNLAARHEPAWTAIAVARLAYRLTPLVALGGAAWGGQVEAAADSLDEDPPRDRALWGAGFQLELTPLAERDFRVQPVLRFGIESVTLDDRLDRDPAFVFGAGIERRLAAAWALGAAVENRFFTIEREPLEGVASSRDVTLWALAATLTWRAGGQ